mgnify:CR=1 FL=1
MSLVFVVQEKNIKNVVELYKKLINTTKAIKPKAMKDIGEILDFNI